MRRLRPFTDGAFFAYMGKTAEYDPGNLEKSGRPQSRISEMIEKRRQRTTGKEPRTKKESEEEPKEKGQKKRLSAENHQKRSHKKESMRKEGITECTSRFPPI